MFNDLRSFPELRKNYQFWFYHYPTGQPFWLSATQFREDFQKLRDDIDPDHRYPAMDKTVLVGHSMGGLVSRMQTIDSTDQFWKILSDEPFENVKGQPEHLAQLRAAAFFKPNESISRVVTIGTPHRGSEYANDTTRWISRHIIQLPARMVATGQALIQQNPGLFRSAELLTSSTSIDSLSPDSPLFPAMLRAPKAPWVVYHNIVGMTKTRKLFHEAEATGDGIVSYDSAHVDDATSEIIVDAEHQAIHQTPKAILEVRRILIEHLARLQGEFRAQQLAQRGMMQRTALAMNNDTSEQQNENQPIARGASLEPALRLSSDSLRLDSPFAPVKKQPSSVFPFMPVGTQSPLTKTKSARPKPMAGAMPMLGPPSAAFPVPPSGSSRKRAIGY